MADPSNPRRFTTERTNKLTIPMPLLVGLIVLFLVIGGFLVPSIARFNYANQSNTPTPPTTQAPK